MPRQPGPALIVLVGAAGSGKSTWAAAHYRASGSSRGTPCAVVGGIGRSRRFGRRLRRARPHRGRAPTAGIDDGDRHARLWMMPAARPISTPANVLVCPCVAVHFTNRRRFVRPERPARRPVPDTGARSASAAIARIAAVLSGKVGPRCSDSRPPRRRPGRPFVEARAWPFRGRIGREQARRVATPASARRPLDELWPRPPGAGRRLRPQHFPISVGADPAGWRAARWCCRG